MQYGYEKSGDLPGVHEFQDPIDRDIWVQTRPRFRERLPASHTLVRAALRQNRIHRPADRMEALLHAASQSLAKKKSELRFRRKSNG